MVSSLLDGGWLRLHFLGLTSTKFCQRPLDPEGKFSSLRCCSAAAQVLVLREQTDSLHLPREIIKADQEKKKAEDLSLISRQQRIHSDRKTKWPLKNKQNPEFPVSFEDKVKCAEDGGVFSSAKWQLCTPGSKEHTAGEAHANAV